MGSSKLVSAVGCYSLPLQCALLCAALVAISLKLGAPAGWLFVASAVVGVVAFVAGIAASFVLQNIRWLALSVAAAFVLFFSFILGMSFGGSPGV